MGVSDRNDIGELSPLKSCPQKEKEKHRSPPSILGFQPSVCRGVTQPKHLSHCWALQSHSGIKTRVYRPIIIEKSNIVLIWMVASGIHKLKTKQNQPTKHNKFQNTSKTKTPNPNQLRFTVHRRIPVVDVLGVTSSPPWERKKVLLGGQFDEKVFPTGMYRCLKNQVPWNKTCPIPSMLVCKYLHLPYKSMYGIFTYILLICMLHVCI